MKNPEAEARGCNPSTRMAGQAVETGGTAETHGPANLGYGQNQNKTQQNPKPYGLKQSYDKQCMTLSPFLAKGILQKPVMACGKVLIPVSIAEKKNLKAS